MKPLKPWITAFGLRVSVVIKLIRLEEGMYCLYVYVPAIRFGMLEEYAI